MPKSGAQHYEVRFTPQQREALILGIESEIGQIRSLIERDARGPDLREGLHLWSEMLETLQQARPIFPGRWGRLANRAMAAKLEAGEAIDVSDCERAAIDVNQPNEANRIYAPLPCYVLTAFQEGVDYCNATEETWIWSIGLEEGTNRIIASHSAALYDNPRFKCIFLR